MFCACAFIFQTSAYSTNIISVFSGLFFFLLVNWDSTGLKDSLWPSPTWVNLTVGDNLIEINLTRSDGSKERLL
jgi:hypothetical protein